MQRLAPFSFILVFVFACADAQPGGQNTENAEGTAAAAHEEAHAGHGDHDEAPAAATASHFGGEIDEAVPMIALADLVSDPASRNGQTVRTEGTVHRVCQRAGCWMEIRDEDAGPVRVPMAGHSFFLPRDASGRRAVIQAKVATRTLDEGEREHLESEGATATTTTLELVATGVTLRDA